MSENNSARRNGLPTELDNAVRLDELLDVPLGERWIGWQDEVAQEIGDDTGLSPAKLARACEIDQRTGGVVDLTGARKNWGRGGAITDQVAAHPNTPDELLVRLADTKHHDRQDILLGRDRLPAEALAVLAASTDRQIAARARARAADEGIAQAGLVPQSGDAARLAAQARELEAELADRVASRLGMEAGELRAQPQTDGSDVWGYVFADADGRQLAGVGSDGGFAFWDPEAYLDGPGWDYDDPNLAVLAGTATYARMRQVEADTVPADAELLAEEAMALGERAERLAAAYREASGQPFASLPGIDANARIRMAESAAFEYLDGEFAYRGWDDVPADVMADAVRELVARTGFEHSDWEGEAADIVSDLEERLEAEPVPELNVSGTAEAVQAVQAGPDLPAGPDMREATRTQGRSL